MPITAAAVVPHPPLLVPEVGRGDPQELADLRSACLRAVAATLTGADALLLVGGGPTLAMAAPGAAASFAPYGVGVRVALPDAAAADGLGRGLDLDRLAGALPGTRLAGPLHELPLSLAVAAWLLVESDHTVPPLAALTVPASLDASGAAALGRELVQAASSAARVGLLVMADLSARRSARAPASLHPAAAAFDQQVGQAVRDGAPGRLLALDAALAAALVVGGLAPLHVLAGALQQTGAARGEVLYEDAPYGVGYLVGVLSPP